MKKALLAIVLAVASLVPIGLSASPASAAGCSTFLSKQNSAYHHYGDGTWLFQAAVGYQICSTTTGDQYAKINEYKVGITLVSTGCGGGTVGTFGHPITGWRVNPDALGAWDAATKTVSNCSPGVISFSGVAGTIVWQSSPSNIRCVSGHATPMIKLWPDGAPATIPNLCVI